MGVQTGPELGLPSVMRELGLEPCQPKPSQFSLTEGNGQEHDIPDLVQHDFTAGPRPGPRIVSDRLRLYQHGRARFSSATVH